MSRSARTKDIRLQIRLDADAKAMLQRAATCRRKTVSQFVLATALEEAGKTIRENDIVAQTGRDWKNADDVQIDQPSPNAALRETFAKYSRVAR